MLSYNKQSSISTYTIDKVLIEHLEDYLKQNVLEILHVPAEASTKVDFTMTLHDSHGIEKYNSIKEHKFSVFRNDIKGITIELDLEIDEIKLQITLRFGDEEENSDLEISLTADNAREKVSAIEQGIFSIINHNKNLNRVFYPGPMISIVIVFGCFLSGLFAWQSTYSIKEKFILGIIFWAGIFYLFCRSYFKGYCSFDTNKQKQLDKWFTWLITGLLGFLLFSTLLANVRKNLFGF